MIIESLSTVLKKTKLGKKKISFFSFKVYLNLIQPSQSELF